jgi:alkylation response protein AidB-like acyl-CoA dehydrogenase
MTADLDVLDAAPGELLASIGARSEEIERQRRVPLDLLDDLRAAGCFRMLVPSDHGGAALDLPTQMHVIEQLAGADASVAWTVMIGSLAPIAFAKLSRATFDALYEDGPDVILAGTFNPTGVAARTPGGFDVTGRWSFASGCQHADWFMGHCIVDDGHVPTVRMMLLRPDQVAIEDTWWVAGLCGTGSHDVVVDGVHVPDRLTFSLSDPPCHPDPLFRIPELSFTAFEIATVAVGIAGGALADIAAMAGAKVPAFADSTLATNPLFQCRLAEADARLRAARVLLDADAASAWATAAAAAPFTPEHRARIRATTTWVTQTAASVVDTAYTAGGGSALYSSNALQRRHRDIHALTQHFAVKPDTFTMAGAVLMGQDVDLAFL